MFPYFIDFAFINQKVAVEIDGSQHLEEDRAEHDLKKDELLKSLGWKVIRFTAALVLHDWNEINESLLKFIDSDKTEEKVGLYTYQSKYTKVKRDENGKSEKERKLIEKRWAESKCPKKEILENLYKEKSMYAIGKMYNVSDHTVKRWLNHYNIPKK